MTIACLQCQYLRKEPQFDWDPANREHIGRHGVTPEEAEQAVRNDPLELGAAFHENELRRMLIGPTDVGRLLTVVFTERKGKFRIVTVHPASRKQRKLYESS